jgi:hypothetical protein
MIGSPLFNAMREVAPRRRDAARDCSQMSEVRHRAEGLKGEMKNAGQAPLRLSRVVLSDLRRLV